MAKASVYIEPTVVSYLTARPTQDKIKSEKQRITREWWTKQRPLFDCFISETVIQEISAGEAVMAAKRLEAVKEFRNLAAPEAALILAKQMVSLGVLPPKAAVDALHIAIAAAAGMEFLMTWNCTHIANAQIESRVRRLCAESGMSFPVICTPEELMGA